MKTILNIFFLMLLLSSCNKAMEPPLAKSRLILSDSLLEVLSIDTVRSIHFEQVHNLSGKITFAEERVVEIFPMFGGNVVEVRAELGDFVDKGSILAVLRSSEVADYQQQEMEADSKLQIAQKNFDVAIDMSSSGLMSEKDVLIAQKELENAQSQLTKIKEIISIYNISGNSQYAIKSPVSGFVVKKNINREMQLRSDNNMEIFTISGLDEVWVLANIYERDINKIKINDGAEIIVSAYPDMVWKASIDKIYNILDPQSKTMTMRIKLANPDFILKPGMFARVKTTSRQPFSHKEICVDEHALIFDDNKHHIVVVKDDKGFEIRVVEVSAIVNGMAAISSGVNENELIVNRNSLLIYNEMN